MMENKNNNLPDELKELIDKAIENGADVTVVKYDKNKNKTETKYTKKDIADEIDEQTHAVDRLINNHTKIKGMLKDAKAKIPSMITDQTDEEVFRNCIKSFQSLVDATGRHPLKGVTVLVPREGNTVITGCNILKTKDLIRFLRDLADSLEEGNFTSDVDDDD